MNLEMKLSINCLDFVNSILILVTENSQAENKLWVSSTLKLENKQAIIHQCEFQIACHQ